jgi:hypothetical protein
MKYLRTRKDLNVLINSSNTAPKFFDDTLTTKSTVVIDLTKMKNIYFINRRNKVCVVEPGVTWEDLTVKLKESGLRPRAPWLPRKGKSVVASVLDRAPHLCPKAQFDISDPLLCMEVVFGNGEIFRTGEAAGPRSIEENRAAGGALKNPLGPGQTDIFRLIQGSKGTFGCVTWISIQCDFLPKIRVVKFINNTSIDQLTEFVYTAVRRRLIDEVFIINSNLFKAIFPNATANLNRFILIYAINGYEWLPEEKISYQLEDCTDILIDLSLEYMDSLAGIQQRDVEPLLDGGTVDPHPKYSDKTVAVDVFYNTTLDRISSHIEAVNKILKTYEFPTGRVNIYVQPVIQARAAQVEFSLMAKRPEFDGNRLFSYDSSCAIAKEIAQYVVSHGGFFSRPYKLVREFAFEGHDIYVENLRKLKAIFDPDSILNKGALCF